MEWKGTCRINITYLGLSGGDSLDSETSLGVVQEAEVLVGLFDGDHI